MERKYFNIKESDNEVVVEVFGEIGGSWWSEGVTLESVKEQLKGVAGSKKNVIVRVNSLGGDVDEALAIYELLVGMGDRVTTECYGRCASAATIIAMAGAKRKMSRYALFLIHKCWCGVVGNENVLEEVLEEQRAINSRLVAIYVDRTGARKEDIEALMERNNGDGAWLTVDECIEQGFMHEEMQKASGSEASYLTGKIKNMFNFNKKSSQMKKTIASMAMLCALLNLQELEAKDEKVLMDDEMLKQIETRLNELTNQASTAMQDKEITAKAQAKAEAEVAELKNRVAELEAVVAKTPAVAPAASGSDTKDEPKFEEWYNQQGYVQEAKRSLGR